MNRVYLRNAGVCSAFGGNDATWAALMAGKSGVGRIANFDAAGLGLPTQVASEIPAFDEEALAHLGLRTRDLAGEISPFVLYALAAAHETMGGLNWRDAPLADQLRAGICLGSGGSGLPAFEALTEATLAGYPERKERLRHMRDIFRFLINMPTGQLSIRYGLRGPEETFGDACAAGLKAIIGAVRCVLLDEADVMLAGGTEAVICRTAMAAFNLMDPRGSTGGAMTLHNDDPAGASCPGSVNHDGFVMGEGAATVLVQKEPPASGFYAEVAGYASTGDADNMAVPPGDGSAAYNALNLALSRAGMPPEGLDAVILHYTSTAAGDKAESLGLRNLLGDHAAKVMAYAPKAALGHWLGASGPLGTWVAMQAMQRHELPPALNLTPETLDPDCAGLGHFVRGKPIKVVAVLAMGFGGTNAALVLKLPD